MYKRILVAVYQTAPTNDSLLIDSLTLLNTIQMHSNDVSMDLNDVQMFSKVIQRLMTILQIV